MIEQLLLPIADLPGELLRQFIEQLLVLSYRAVAGNKRPGRNAGDVPWHGSQNGVVAVSQSKLSVKCPRLRANGGEVAAPAYVVGSTDRDVSSIANILNCYVSTRKYARLVHRCTDELGISKSGDPYMRKLLVQCAHHILGHYGKDSALRQWGLAKSEGSKKATLRAIVAVARKLSVLLHRLWSSGEFYKPFPKMV